MTVFNEYQLRQEIIRVTRIVANQGLIRSSDGNLSVRLDENRILMTPSGLYKMSMEPDDPIVVNEQGEVLIGKPGLKPTSEINMHLEAFRQRPDINAVLHAHPPYATALTIAGLPFPTDYLPEVLIALGDVPVANYGTPGTPALAESIQKFIKDHNAIILSHHGSLTVGETLEEALIGLERLEHAAYTYSLAHNLSQPVPLSEEELTHLREVGERIRG
ncbi:MAG: class II aldolase/adducin family protein [Chloroflexi bacterium]|nr:class II aldolase/adducin family protein [Chloroflexota bacterium]